MAFRWDKKKLEMASDLAEGKQVRVVALKHGVSEGYILKLRKKPEFAAKMDELTLAFGIAKKGERIRIIQSVIDQKMAEGAHSKKDLLDWVVEARKETEGDAVANVNVTMHITQAMQELPAAERPAAYLNLARGLVLGLNTVPGIVRNDPDVINNADEDEVDLINAPVGGGEDDSGDDDNND